MADRPTITAEIVFLAPTDGGRAQLPWFGAGMRYTSHLVVQSRDVRRALIDDDGMGREDYLGVAFIDGPADLRADVSGRFELELMYAPQVSYAGLQVGATFTVREGGRIVAHGEVLSRSDAKS